MSQHGTMACDMMGTFITAAMIPYLCGQGKANIQNGNLLYGSLLMALGCASAGLCYLYAKNTREYFHRARQYRTDDGRSFSIV